MKHLILISILSLFTINAFAAPLSNQAKTLTCQSLPSNLKVLKDYSNQEKDEWVLGNTTTVYHIHRAYLDNPDYLKYAKTDLALLIDQLKSKMSPPLTIQDHTLKSGYHQNKPYRIWSFTAQHGVGTAQHNAVLVMLDANHTTYYRVSTDISPTTVENKALKFMTSCH